MSDKLKTALIGIPLIIIITNWSSGSFFILVLAVIIAGLIEYNNLMEEKGCRPQKIIGLFCGIFIALSIYIFERRADVRTTGVVLTVFIVISLFILLIKEDSEGIINSTSVTLFGIFYIAWPISHFILLRDMRPYGRSFIFLLFFSTLSINLIMSWIENKFTRKKMKFRTDISPYIRLSVSGISGMAAVLVWSKILSLGFFKPWAVNLNYISFTQSLVIGLLIGLCIQAGYLFNSLIKAGVSAKTRKELLPGYGSMLDMASSFQFSVPVIYYYVNFFIV